MHTAMQHVCNSPVRPAEPVCSSSWPVVASAPPAAPPVAAAHCSAVPATEAPPALPAPASEEGRESRQVGRTCRFIDHAADSTRAVAPPCCT